MLFSKNGLPLSFTWRQWMTGLAFYGALVTFMTEGPVVVAALERTDAVAHLRKAMGATDSRKAEAGTVRNLFGTDIERNAIHGSDSSDNAAAELAFFFSRAELLAAG